jgi:hypothetical protein
MIVDSPLIVSSYVILMILQDIITVETYDLLFCHSISRIGGVNLRSLRVNALRLGPQ